MPITYKEGTHIIPSAGILYKIKLEHISPAFRLAMSAFSYLYIISYYHLHIPTLLYY